MYVRMYVYTHPGNICSYFEGGCAQLLLVKSTSNGMGIHKKWAYLWDKFPLSKKLVSLAL